MGWATVGYYHRRSASADFCVTSERAIFRRFLGNFISEISDGGFYRFQLSAFLDYVVLHIEAIGAGLTWWI